MHGKTRWTHPMTEKEHFLSRFWRRHVGRIDPGSCLVVSSWRQQRLCDYRWQKQYRHRDGWILSRQLGWSDQWPSRNRVCRSCNLWLHRTTLELLCFLNVQRDSVRTESENEKNIEPATAPKAAELLIMYRFSPWPLVECSNLLLAARYSAYFWAVWLNAASSCIAPTQWRARRLLWCCSVSCWNRVWSAVKALAERRDDDQHDARGHHSRSTWCNDDGNESDNWDGKHDEWRTNERVRSFS